jgi:hypothetical protein
MAGLDKDLLLTLYPMLDHALDLSPAERVTWLAAASDSLALIGRGKAGLFRSDHEAVADYALELEEGLAQRLPGARLVPVLPQEIGQLGPRNRARCLPGQVGQKGEILSAPGQVACFALQPGLAQGSKQHRTPGRNRYRCNGLTQFLTAGCEGGRSLATSPTPPRQWSPGTPRLGCRDGRHQRVNKAGGQERSKQTSVTITPT